MKKPGKIIVKASFRASPDIAGEKIRQDRNEKHMAEDGGTGNHIEVAPSVLKAQLPAQVDKISVFLEQGKLLDTGQVVVFFLFFLKETSYLGYFVPRRIGPLDYVEFPAGGVEMGGIEDPFAYRIVDAREIMPETIDKIKAKRRYDRFKPFVDPLRQFLIFLFVFLDTVEYLGFEVGYHKTFEKFEKPALDYLEPAEPFGRFLKFSKEISNGHLVRLFIELLQFDRPYLVIPPLHSGGVE